MQQITTHLWFDKEALEAAEFYVSLFPNSKITSTVALTGTPSGDCSLVAYELAGMLFMAINAGPAFVFNPSVSFLISCSTREEVDSYWQQLSPGGKVLMPLGEYPFSEWYGWLEDRYGLSWQVMFTGGSVRQRLTPVLMFVGEMCGRAEEAVNHYVSILLDAPGSLGIEETALEVVEHYATGTQPDREETLEFSRFLLLGKEYGAMDSAYEHQFAFNEAISFLIPCNSQEEIDYLWEKLAADPDSGQCGWLKDRFGFSWQISPVILQKMLQSDDKNAVQRVTEAFLQMKKFDIAALVRAEEG